MIAGTVPVDTDSPALGRLVYEIARIWRARIDNSLQGYGLSRAKWDLIMALENRDDEGLSQRELARLCGVEPPSIASLLERMEKEGWVVRRICSDDRRSKRTLLTEKARAIRVEIREISRQVEREVFANLPPASYDDIKRSLQQLRDVLEKTHSSTDTKKQDTL